MRRRFGVCGLDAGAAAVIRIDAVWLAVQPIDMRAGTERLLGKRLAAAP
jgi:transposase